MSDALLQADELCTHYGKSQALFGISLRLPTRGGVSILGRNGAGKTTLLRTLAGDLNATSGTIEFDGEAIAGEPTEKRVRRGLGYVPQEQGVFGSLSVRENLLIGAHAQPNPNREIEEITTLFPRLGQRMAQKAGTLSGGERKMLAIGRALLGKPLLLMLDEPTEGVWHEVVDEIGQRLDLLAQRIAILIVEQNVKLALRVTQFCYVMDRGKIALDGPSEQIRQDPNLTRLLAP